MMVPTFTLGPESRPCCGLAFETLRAVLEGKRDERETERASAVATPEWTALPLCEAFLHLERENVGLSRATFGRELLRQPRPRKPEEF